MSTTVVIPTYKASPFIRETLASVFAQTRLPDEVIVVDDCSPDDTAAVVEGLSKAAPARVQLIRRVENSGGPAKPTNEGIRAARSELIAVLDQDDVLVPSKLEDQSLPFDGAPEVVLVAGRAALVGAPDELTWPRSVWPEALRVPGSEILRRLLEHGMFFSGYPGFMFRKSAWAAVGGIDESLRISSDYDFACKLCLHGDAVQVPQIGYWRREHGENLSRDRLSMYLEVMRIRRRYWSKIAGQIARPERLRIYEESLDLAYEAKMARRWADACRCLGWAVRFGGPGRKVFRRAFGIARAALLP